MFSALNPLGDIKLIWVQSCVNVSVSYVSTCLHNNISIHYNLDLDDKGESGWEARPGTSHTANKPIN